MRKFKKKVIKTPLYLYVITNSSLIHKLALFIFSETLFLILGCRKKTKIAEESNDILFDSYYLYSVDLYRFKNVTRFFQSE